MRPELFHIPGLDIPIYGYGLMVVLGFLAASYFARWLANRSGLDGEVFVNAALLALVTGILGARLSHVLENPGNFFGGGRTVGQTLWEIVNLRSGGLTYYGGFLLAFPTLVLYGMWKKVPIPVGMDIVAPALMIGLGLGRVGCYLNGCCHGATCPADFPLAVTFPYYSNAYVDHFNDPRTREKLGTPRQFLDEEGGEARLMRPEEIRRESARPGATPLPDPSFFRSLPVHPAQLYSTLTAFLLAALLTAYYALPHTAGRVFALMLVLEGGSRFLLEMLRTEPAVLTVGGVGMSLSMVLGLGLVALGAALWGVFGWLGGRVEPEAQGMPATA